MYMKLLIILLLFYYVYTQTSIESMTNNNTRLVLMGDSILKNDSYVDEGDSVGDQIKTLHENTLIVAEDGGTVPDLKHQFENIPSLKDKSTEIIISIGGNDLLQAYAFNDVNDLSGINTIFNEYVDFLTDIKNKCNSSFTLCTIYYPKSESFIHFYDLIELWNSKLEVYTSAHGDKIIYLDDEMDRPSYFTHQIEPSNSGGAIIADLERCLI